VEFPGAISGIPVNDGPLLALLALLALLGSVVEQVGVRSSAAAASPTLPGVTVVAVMISESGSTAAWPL
jgi:hypothetical protein